MHRLLLRGTLLIAWAMVTQPVWPGPVVSADLPPHQERPVVKAAALYMVELESGRVLLEKDATRRLPPASLTKIMTALIALEAAPLQQVVKIDRRAIVHHSPYDFRAEEEYLLRDLLTAMLVASANESAGRLRLVAERIPNSVGP